ncbi:hypothetical protein AWB81_05661 [Caballeronia arationis]|uniref:peptidoglycan recognition protein family protein n=1 Tax=Caballeronia arationis TaxID=1777142 RepID=UPI00074BD5AB|nr:N-acetylmuramoyl-L-alanine amidase [Caballeronia arationis]SAK99026.1 hypothetical protein AWB81_05661 [Caballeronia arationis]
MHNYNTGVIGIVLLENLTTPDEGRDGIAMVRELFDAIGFNERTRVPERQKQSLEAFIAILREFYYIDTLGGHREFPGQLGEGKTCPGNFGLALVKDLRKSTGLSAP